MSLDDVIDQQIMGLKKRKSKGEIKTEVKKMKMKDDTHKEEKKSKKHKKKGKDASSTDTEIVKKMNTTMLEETSVERVKHVSDDSEETALNRKKKKKSKQKLEQESEPVTLSKGGKTSSELKEKKREKRLKKKEAKIKEKVIQKKNVENRDSVDSTGCKFALEYLNKWKNDRDGWSFQKVRQVWLLKHMYNHTLVGDDDFKILLEYLEGLKGKSREVTVNEAEQVIQAHEETETSAESSDGEDKEATTKTEKPSEEKYNRARQVIQLL